jgi:NitT/TauT family transport system ATP-binding protein
LRTKKCRPISCASGKAERKHFLFVTRDIDEAIYMSDRILIMTQAPGRIDREIHIDLARPRDRTSDSFLRFRSEILEHLHFAGRAANVSA